VTGAVDRVDGGNVAAGAALDHVALPVAGETMSLSAPPLTESVPNAGNHGLVDLVFENDP
jgi:hypothetical protein